MIANYKNDETGEVVTAIYRDANSIQYRRTPEGIVLTDAVSMFDLRYTRIDDPAAEDTVPVCTATPDTLARDIEAAGDLIAQLKARVRELEEDAAEDDALRQRMADLLTGVALGLKGPPEPNSLHDWSGLPQLAHDTRARIVAIEQAAGPFSMYWAMIEAEAELVGEVPDDSAIACHFMGSGASTMVTYGQMRAMFDAIYQKALAGAAA